MLEIRPSKRNDVDLLADFQLGSSIQELELANVTWTPNGQAATNSQELKVPEFKT
jgi:hypothetical protein